MKLHLILNHPYFYPLLIGIAGGAIAGYFYWELRLPILSGIAFRLPPWLSLPMCIVGFVLFGIGFSQFVDRHLDRVTCEKLPFTCEVAK
jgi:hypothetical protein